MLICFHRWVFLLLPMVSVWYGSSSVVVVYYFFVDSLSPTVEPYFWGYSPTISDYCAALFSFRLIHRRLWLTCFVDYQKPSRQILLLTTNPSFQNWWTLAQSPSSVPISASPCLLGNFRFRPGLSYRYKVHASGWPLSCEIWAASENSFGTSRISLFEFSLSVIAKVIG